MGVKRPDLAERNRRSATHGMSDTPIYFCYKEMVYRCVRRSHHAYKDYGGRGITVCADWSGETGFSNFLRDMGVPEKGYQLDRKDNNSGYSPENCRWVSSKVNCRNRRSSRAIEFNGEKRCIAEWAEKLGIDRKALEQRLRTQSVEKALTTPYKPYKRNI